ncbi:hypothetical protein BDD12DRAFT_810796 [Trichophaea hybrida]|nr:hypothetical protein BDD12DRAFT_810796 [Trichophaea hybrida]
MNTSHMNYPILLLLSANGILGRHSPLAIMQGSVLRIPIQQMWRSGGHYLDEHQWAAQGIIAKQVCEIAPDQYVDNFCNMSNDDWQKQVAKFISPCTYQFHHSDC